MENEISNNSIQCLIIWQIKCLLIWWKFVHLIESVFIWLKVLSSDWKSSHLIESLVISLKVWSSDESLMIWWTSYVSDLDSYGSDLNSYASNLNSYVTDLNSYVSNLSSYVSDLNSYVSDLNFFASEHISWVNGFYGSNIVGRKIICSTTWKITNTVESRRSDQPLCVG